MNTKALSVGILSSVALVGGFIALWLLIIAPALEREDITAPEPTPSASATLLPENEGIPPVATEGQAADGGDFAPLKVPSGVTSGVGALIPADQLTPIGVDFVAGTGHVVVGRAGAIAGGVPAIILDGYQPETRTAPYLLISVDDVSEPLTGEARDTALATGGQEAWQDRVVQTVTARVRHIAGSSAEAWDFYQSVVPVNGALEGMPAVPAIGSDCAEGRTPLAGHEAVTNDTVQVCFYAFGTVSRPADPVSSISITARVGDSIERHYYQSNWNPIIDPGHSHEGDGEAVDVDEHQH